MEDCSNLPMNFANQDGVNTSPQVKILFYCDGSSLLEDLNSTTQVESLEGEFQLGDDTWIFIGLCDNITACNLWNKYKSRASEIYQWAKFPPTPAEKTLDIKTFHDFLLQNNIRHRTYKLEYMYKC